MKQDDILTVDIIDYGMHGEGIARQDGFVLFVPFAVKNEKVKVKVTYVKKNFADAKLLKVIVPSEYRVLPNCPAFTRCGGCDLLHVAYGEQLKIKKQALVNTFSRYPQLRNLEVADCLPSAPDLAYRNKAQLPFGNVGGKAVLGFFEENSHKIVPVEKCCLHGEWLDNLIAAVLDYTNKNAITVYNERTGKGLLRHLVARNLKGHISVIIVINGEEIPCADALIAGLRDALTNFSLHLSVNTENTNVVLGSRLVTLVENPAEIDICGVKFKVNPLSFLQVNDGVRDDIYSRIVDWAADSDVVIDAFSGVGIMGALVAKRGVPRVYNIEIVKEASEDADALAAANDLSGRITNLTGDAAIELPKLIESLPIENQKLTIILDPPRKGVDGKVIDALNGVNCPANLIYVSCNPATLARDLSLLAPNYRILSVTPYDMFPHTRHVETLICLTKKS